MSPDMDDATLSGLMHALEVVEINPGRPAPVMVDAALWYASKLAWPVFPVHHPVLAGAAPYPCSCGNDCKSPGKHPMTPTGFKDATTDVDIINTWWDRWPDANIATPTGTTGCGHDVIDIDGPEGLDTLRDWRRSGGAGIPPMSALAFTPGNRKRKAGRHWFTPATGTTNTTRALPGIDLRGDGGYVLLSPSRGITGPRYEWITWPTAGGAA